MTDTAKQIRSKVDAFVAEITDLVREDALRQISEALGRVTPSAPVRRGPGRPRKDGTTPSAKPAGRSAGTVASRVKGEKRTSADLATTASTISSYIKNNPGQGVEQIAKGIGASTHDLKLPIKKLLADGVIKSKGQRRGTKYLPK